MSKGRNKPARPDPVYREYDPQKRDAYIFDMDGTLALLGGRNPYDASHCDLDPINWPVLKLALMIGKDPNVTIIIVSGRDDKFLPQTERWLQEKGVRYSVIFMRRTGHMGANGRKENDSVVKAEIFRDKIAPFYNILGAFDDRDRVVEMWRWFGVPCFQVQPGDF